MAPPSPEKPIAHLSVILINGFRTQLRFTDLHLSVNFGHREFTVDRLERYDIVPFVVDAVDPLLGVLPRIMFDTHFIFVDQ